MYMCEECNYIWEEQQRYIGDPETTHCPKCGSAEIEETKPQNLAKPNAHSVLDVGGFYTDLLKIRDALIAKDINEAYHVLYGMADPEFNKFNPWEEWEKAAVG